MVSGNYKGLKVFCAGITVPFGDPALVLSYALFRFADTSVTASLQGRRVTLASPVQDELDTASLIVAAFVHGLGAVHVGIKSFKQGG